MFVATLGDTLIAKSEIVWIIENNIYFPEMTLKQNIFYKQKL